MQPIMTVDRRYFSEFTTPGGIVRKAFAASWTDSTGTHSGVSWYDGRDGTTYMTRDVDANMADTGAPAVSKRCAPCAFPRLTNANL